MKKRQNNLLLFNFPEDSSITVEERSSKDKDIVSNILKVTQVGQEAQPITMFRLEINVKCACDILVNPEGYHPPLEFSTNCDIDAIQNVSSFNVLDFKKRDIASIYDR
ncbi:hypothetical protein O3M35_002511 [Rhynocoris fuscipes]|uniref:Uncharacterized protein n=1 Tax=Rhynocoris fuscipes TaxID=488301 RepID=A0AAW1CM33_9HEMI